MPMYEFQCEHKHITSVVNSIADYQKPPEKCDGKITEVDEKQGAIEKPCPSTKFTKVIGGGSFILMGGGWARDGYR